jgi:hypothetical protein
LQANPRPLRVAIVGPCTAGKSTLSARLKAAGYEARHVAQEHSYVPDMWQRITKPDVLIYLDVTFESAKVRRKIWWGADVIDVETERLRHARQHCDLYISTDQFTADEVASQVLDFLTHWQD